jgi:hypothetical protein
VTSVVVVRLFLGAVISLSMLTVGNWVTVVFTAGIIFTFCVLEPILLALYDRWAKTSSGEDMGRGV